MVYLSMGAGAFNSDLTTLTAPDTQGQAAASTHRTTTRDCGHLYPRTARAEVALASVAPEVPTGSRSLSRGLRFFENRCSPITPELMTNTIKRITLTCLRSDKVHYDVTGTLDKGTLQWSVPCLIRAHGQISGDNSITRCGAWYRSILPLMICLLYERITIVASHWNREVGRKNVDLQHLHNELLEWLFREYVISPEFGEARACTYSATVNMVTNEPMKEWMLLYFGPCLTTFIQRIGREADQDIKAYIQRKKEDRNAANKRARIQGNKTAIARGRTVRNRSHEGDWHRLDGGGIGSIRIRSPQEAGEHGAQGSGDPDATTKGPSDGTTRRDVGGENRK